MEAVITNFNHLKTHRYFTVMISKKTSAILLITLLNTISSLLGGTFTVSSLTGGTNANGLYAAITGVNTSSDLTNTIAFSTNGTITLTTSLPSISNPVLINGFSAPTWSNVPVVSINFNSSPGLVFAGSSSQSTLQGLSLINARTPGVTLQSSSNNFYGNSIGLALDGITIAPNYGGGIFINPTSSYNMISYTQNFESTNISYYNTTNLSVTVSGWQGIRGSTTTNAYLTSTNNYLITGTANGNYGLLYIGNIQATSGTSFLILDPNLNYETSIYGPDLPSNGSLRLVGTAKGSSNDIINGFLFEGTTNDFNNPANYLTIDYPNASYNYVHSTMGGLAVVNVDNTNGILASSSWIYDIPSRTFTTQIQYPGSITDSSYGIWWNGGTRYTICGGYSTNLIAHITNFEQPIGTAFLVDYDSSVSGSNAFTHWSSFAYPANTNYVSHFEGISSPNAGYYTLSADSSVSSTNKTAVASLVTIPRQAGGSFGTATWIPLNYPLPGSTTSADSVYGNNIVGFADTNSPSLICMQAVVNALDVVNTISDNRGSGVTLKSSPMNLINACFLNSNTAYGFSAFGNCNGTSIEGNTTSNNALGAYYLMHATGITVTP